VTDGQWEALALVLALVLTFGATADRWSDHLRPRTAVRLLLSTSFALAAAALTAVTMAALPLAGLFDGLADGRWSDRAFANWPAGSKALAVLAVAAVMASLARGLRELREQRRALSAVRQLRRAIGPTADGVVVVASDELDAVAVDVDLILLTRGLIRSLNADERRAVLAHERAHLANRHHRYARVAAVIAAVNPLLLGVPRTTGYLLERWADEDAAAATSRQDVAAALTRVVATGAPARTSAGPPVALRAARVALERRICAIDREQQRPRLRGIIAPVLLVGAVLALAGGIAERTLDIFQLASALHHIAGP